MIIVEEEMEKVLINSNEYSGQYVAMVSLEDSTIVGAGINPQEAMDSARAKGVQDPYILYVPDKDLVYIYYVG